MLIFIDSFVILSKFKGEGFNILSLSRQCIFNKETIDIFIDNNNVKWIKRVDIGRALKYKHPSR